MSTSSDVERVAAPICTAAGMELVDVELRSGNLVITVDREGGVDLDTLGPLSKQISAALDLAEVGPKGHYDLEVSSPGLERRLRRPEHFQRFVGHEVSVRTKAGTPGDRRVDGRIESADGAGITLVGPEVPSGSRRLAYGEIDRAHTVFDWRAALAGTESPTARRARPDGPKDARKKSGTTRQRAEREVTETA